MSAASALGFAAQELDVEQRTGGAEREARTEGNATDDESADRPRPAQTGGGEQEVLLHFHIRVVGDAPALRFFHLGQLASRDGGFQILRSQFLHLPRAKLALGVHGVIRRGDRLALLPLASPPSLLRLGGRVVPAVQVVFALLFLRRRKVDGVEGNRRARARFRNGFRVLTGFRPGPVADQIA